MSISRVISLSVSLAISFGFAVLATVSASEGVQAATKKCLVISSYHKGYAHADKIEAGVRTTLKGHCEVRQFDMDTKRHSSAPAKKKSALAAKAVIDSWKPNVRQSRRRHA